MNQNEKKQKDRRQTFRMFALVSQFGFSMLTPILIGFFLGMFLDKKCGTNYIMIILFFVGAVVGFRNVYVLATGSLTKHTYKRNRQEDIQPEITSEEDAAERLRTGKALSKEKDPE